MRDIEQAVEKALERRQAITGDAIDVDVKAGVVRLTGSVPSEAARVTAATTARATKGVKAVLWEDLQIKMSDGRDEQLLGFPHGKDRSRRGRLALRRHVVSLERRAVVVSAGARYVRARACDGTMPLVAWCWCMVAGCTPLARTATLERNRAQLSADVATLQAKVAELEGRVAGLGKRVGSLSNGRGRSGR